MGYSASLLASGERIVRIAHQHWFVFVANARFAVLALILAALASVLGLAAKLEGVAWQILGFVILALFVFGVLSVIWTILRYRNEEYVITNRRLIHAEGVINKKATDSSLEKINDAVLIESVFGRMFGFGDLDVLTASESGIERLRMLQDAKDFKKAMIEAKHELELELTRPTMPPLRTTEPVAAPPAPAETAVGDDEPEMTADEVANALDRLAEMRDKALITPEEFEAKRTELLGRL